MTEILLDASALIALVRNEQGAARVQAALGNTLISAVNYAEVVTKMLEYGKTLETVLYDLGRLQMPILPFTEEQAAIAASLRSVTRSHGLSLGDRACIALGMQRKCRILTTDKAWKACGIAADIEVIR